jgi:hypothetical protein
MVNNISGNIPILYDKEALDAYNASSIVQHNNTTLVFNPQVSATSLSSIASNEVEVSEEVKDGKTIVTEKDLNGTILKETITDENGDKKIVEYKNGEPYRTTNLTRGGQIKEVVSTINGREYRSVCDSITMTLTTFIDGKQIKSEKRVIPLPRRCMKV